MPGTLVGPANVYEAFNSPGKPVCAYGVGGLGDGLTVSMYFSKKGRLKGVVVYDLDTDEELGTFGKVPADRHDG